MDETYRLSLVNSDLDEVPCASGVENRKGSS